MHHFLYSKLTVMITRVSTIFYSTFKRTSFGLHTLSTRILFYTQTWQTYLMSVCYFDLRCRVRLAIQTSEEPFSGLHMSSFFMFSSLFVGRHKQRMINKSVLLAAIDKTLLSKFNKRRDTNKEHYVRLSHWCDLWFAIGLHFTILKLNCKA